MPTTPQPCSRCGSSNAVDLYIIDGIHDGHGNSIGVPLCLECADGDNVPELPPDDPEPYPDSTPGMGCP